MVEGYETKVEYAPNWYITNKRDGGETDLLTILGGQLSLEEAKVKISKCIGHGYTRRIQYKKNMLISIDIQDNPA